MNKIILIDKLDNIVISSLINGRDNLVSIGYGRDQNKARLNKSCFLPIYQYGKPDHFRYIPDTNAQVKLILFEFFQRSKPLFYFNKMSITNFHQNTLDRMSHAAGIVGDKSLHLFTHLKRFPIPAIAIHQAASRHINN